jgi:sigma-B regulation protein RsbU (phosphoserine phosphatase)
MTKAAEQPPAGVSAPLPPEAVAVLDVLEAAASSLELQRTADYALSGLKALFPFDVAHIFVRERTGRDIVCQRFRGRGREHPREAIEQGIVGSVLAHGRALLRSTVGEEHRGPDLNPDTRSAMAAPIIGGEGRLLGAVLVESSERGRYDDAALESLMGYTRAIGAPIERALLYAQMLEDRRLEGEMVVARQVMAGILPSEAPRIEGFDIAAVIEPCYEVGGDYYDFIPLGDDRFSFAMADVSGKGVPAALVVAALRATLYTLARRELALRAILRYANEFIHLSTGPKAKYVTLFYAVLDARARRFIYINGGHLPPVVLRANGDVELLRSGGFPLGFFDNPRYFEQFVKLETGDLVCLYTDGITEAANAEESDYGRAQLIEVLRKHQSVAASEICDAVLGDVRRFSGKAPTDDASLLVIKAL